MSPRAARWTSPQSTDHRLQAWVERIWHHDDGDTPVRVTLGPPPSDHVIAEQYAVLPHPRAVRFLVPMGSRATSVASFRRYIKRRAPVSQSIRTVLAGGYAVGLADRVFPHRLVVSVDRRFPERRWAEVLVLRHLAAALGRTDLLAFTAVRRINPNAKPTLQLFDVAGSPVGFAKLGDTEATRELVRTEAAAITAVDGRLGSVVTPRLLAAGDWGEIAYAVGAPLPLEMKRWTGGPDATAPALLDIAGSGSGARGPLAGSTYAARLRKQIAALTGRSDVGPWLAAWIDRIERDPRRVEFGRAHGDWIPDNMGQIGAGLAVWDWEHSADDTPVGFDLLHWHFHHALVAHDLAAAVAAVGAASPGLALVGVPVESRELVVSTYLLDLFVRRTKLAIGGGGWNAKWYPGVIEVARRQGGG